MSYLSTRDLEQGQSVVRLQPVAASALETWKGNAAHQARRWVEASGFEASAGQFCAVPGAEGELERWLFGLDERGWLCQLAALPGAGAVARRAERRRVRA